MHPAHILDTPIGRLTIHWDQVSGKVTQIDLPNSPPTTAHHVALADLPSPARALIDQLAEYFAGDRRTFDAALFTFPDTTDFRRAVYRYLFHLAPGETRTYGQIAAAVGHPGAARAVGTAMATNPLPIVVPCHRVLSSNGIGGYGGGLCCKRTLLRHEGIQS